MAGRGDVRDEGWILRLAGAVVGRGGADAVDGTADADDGVRIRRGGVLRSRRVETNAREDTAVPVGGGDVDGAADVILL